ncbi:MAG TPA: methylenetetrahydrofolate reductase [NAD(P)H] [Candidatus Eremiobacteraceae bacterium]|nr:methylenetetrahydrofolate reductase [NAD(P)H] [Candidatus Eremiobacteraceae bacterium]
MRISDVLRTRKPAFSFEFFPPKDDAQMAALLETVETLRPLDPAFVSVTYRPGGSTGARTLEVTARIKRDLRIEAMAHLTCVGATVARLREILREIGEAGIENVLALRGDPPAGTNRFVPVEGGLAHASDLAQLAVDEFGYCVGGACYPEKHPEAHDAATDLRALRTKIEGGASFLITQLFFDNDRYFEFVSRARRAGIDAPIVPGIMPITNVDQIQRFTKLCGATIPERLHAELLARRSQPEAVLDLGVAYATLQCVDLLARGAPAIHFYTLNKSPATRAVVSALLAARSWEPARGLRYLENADAIVESALSIGDIDSRSY